MLVFTYAWRFGLVGDGGRTGRGGGEAPLDPYTTQHVQQYLSIRTFRFNKNIKHTHTCTQMQLRHAHTHHKKQREETEGDR